MICVRPPSGVSKLTVVHPVRKRRTSYRAPRTFTRGVRAVGFITLGQASQRFARSSPRQHRGSRPR